jgi:peptide/nickel transport system ATP-binding protein
VGVVLLEMRDVRIGYRTGGQVVEAVRGASLTVDAGQTLGLAGESGSGKSSLAMAALRLLPPEARVGGRVLLDGEDVLDMSWGRLRAVRWAQASVVFQGALHVLNPVHRVGAQIAEPIMLHQGLRRADARGRAAALLERVGLDARRARDRPHQLSGGERQRVMIAIALACSPKLIIADEPTTALDAVTQAQILGLLAGLVAERQAGLVLIGHDLAVLSSVCDRLAVMYGGRIVEEGDTRAVLGDPLHPYTRALAAASPRIGDPAFRYRPVGLAGEPPDPARPSTGCAFRPRCTVARPECARTPVELVAGGPDGHRAACVLVRPDGADQPRPVGARA